MSGGVIIKPMFQHIGINQPQMWPTSSQGLPTSVTDTLIV